MRSLVGILLVGLVLAGCQTNSKKNVSTSDYANNFSTNFVRAMSDKEICVWAVNGKNWDYTRQKFFQEANRRGLGCGVGEASTNNPEKPDVEQSKLASTAISEEMIVKTNFGKNLSVGDKILRVGQTAIASRADLIDAVNAEISRKVSDILFLVERKNNGIEQFVFEPTQNIVNAMRKELQDKKIVITPSSSVELTVSQKEAERLRQELAALKAQQQQQRQIISRDKQKPVINIAGTAMNGPQGTIKGYVRDNMGIAEVRVDGKLVEVDSYGNFIANTYVPDGGINVLIEAVDLAGLANSMSVRLDRLASTTATTITFDRLNPLGRKVSSNSNALALIIGVDSYKSTPARAMYADSDAKAFSDYASQKLGIPTNRIKTLINDGAGERELLLSVKSWLSRSVNQNQSDVYIFFAGHGLASDDGSKMYLLPYDGAPELLDDTAILRDRLFSDIASANPRSVTVFLDTCYSGTTRGTDVLIASRPIAIKAMEQSIPDNFTVMTAARGDQTAKPLEEAKHGMFSYFLMKGMEGEADQNQDNKITAGELHSYVQSNVIQQSSGSQTPELQGDAERVLVRFQ